MLAKVERGEFDHCIDTLWAQIQLQQDAKVKKEEGEGELSPAFPPNTPPEVVEFVRDLTDWTNPFDVPQCVWSVAGGSGVSLRPKVTALKKKEATSTVVTKVDRPIVQPQERRSGDLDRGMLHF